MTTPELTDGAQSVEQEAHRKCGFVGPRGMMPIVRRITGKANASKVCAVSSMPCARCANSSAEFAFRPLMAGAIADWAPDLTHCPILQP